LNTSCPKTETEPEVGNNKVVKIFIRVNLPAPFGPKRP